MTTAQQILDIARNELGTTEARDGANKYGRAYGVDRVAWCAQFCWWVFRQANAGDLIHPKTAYTPTLADWFRQRGRFSSTPLVGDLVFYNWPDSVNRIQHVGIVEAVEPAAIIAIEGNTSTTNQSDGGRVMRRRRTRNSSIVGYGHPAYSAPSSPLVEDDLPSPADVWQHPVPDEYTPNPNDGLPAFAALGFTLARVTWCLEQVQAVAGAVQRLETKVDRLQPGGGGAVGVTGLSEQDKNDIAARVVKLLGVKTSA